MGTWHYILQHLDCPGINARILFADFSSVFNAIIPEILSSKLSQLTLSPAIYQWITSFLTGRKQQVKLGEVMYTVADKVGDQQTTPSWKRPSRQCTFCSNWGCVACHRSCWETCTPRSWNPSCVHPSRFGSSTMKQDMKQDGKNHYRFLTLRTQTFSDTTEPCIANLLHTGVVNFLMPSPS